MVNRNSSLIIVILCLQIILLFSPIAEPQAQAIAYNVGKEWVKVWVNTDGSIDAMYNITLTYISGSPQGITTVGLPKGGFSIQYAKDISGTTLKTTDVSSGGFYGVDVYLKQPIVLSRPNTFTLYAVVPSMVSQDATNPGNVGMQFYPSTFDSATGNIGNLRLAIVLPQGVQNTEVKFPTGLPFDNVFNEGNNLVVYWERNNWPPSQQFRAGVSFPAKYVTLGPSSNFYITIAIVAMVVLGIVLTIILLLRRRKAPYEKPRVAVEALGAAKGLTAVEAGVVLDLKPMRVLTMILFGLLLKRLVTVTTTAPLLKLQKLEAPPGGTSATPRYYEIDYLGAIEKDGTLNEMRLARNYVGLKDTVDRKLRGYSRADTVNYYKSVVGDAWKQVAQGGTPELKGDAIEKNVDWLLADDKFDERFKDSFPPGMIFLPRPGWYWYWGGPYIPPTQARVPTGTPTETAPIPGQDFANNVVRSLETASNSMVKNVQDFTNRLIPAQAAATANERSVRAQSSCVCACAHCACACACVGCACACAHGGAR